MRRRPRWWWIPAGVLVAVLIGASIASPIVWAVLAVYTALNAAGTAMLLRELRDQHPLPGRHGRRWSLLAELAFVLQLPVGLLVVVSGGM